MTTHDCPRCRGTGRFSVWQSRWVRLVRWCRLCLGSGWAEVGGGDA
jgi:hypothetical protein